jgi:hypothetical protein
LEVHFPQFGRHVAQVAQLKTVVEFVAGRLIEEQAVDRRDVVPNDCLDGRKADQIERAGRCHW